MKNKTVVKVIFFQAKIIVNRFFFFPPSKWLQIYVVLVF
jgi:hypothetical protein